MINFYCIVHPILWILKIFGFFSVTFEGPVHKGIIKFKFFDKVNLFFKLAFGIVLLFLDTDKFLSQNEPKIETIAWNFRKDCSIVMLIISFIYQLLNHNSIISFLHLLHKANVQVNKLKILKIEWWTNC